MVDGYLSNVSTWFLRRSVADEQNSKLENLSGVLVVFH